MIGLLILSFSFFLFLPIHISSVCAFLLLILSLPILHLKSLVFEEMERKREEKYLRFFLLALNSLLNSNYGLYDSLRIISSMNIPVFSKKAGKAIDLIEKGFEPKKVFFHLDLKSQRVQRAFLAIADALDKGSDLRIVLPHLIEQERREIENAWLEYCESLKSQTILFLYLSVLVPSLLLVSIPILEILGFFVSPLDLFPVFFPLIPAILLVLILRLLAKRP